MSKIKQEVAVMSVNRYKMVDRQTGEVSEGCGVRYMFSTDLHPCAEENLKGYKFGKTSLPYNDFDKFEQVPGIYETELTMSIASDGTVKVKAENFVFKRPLVSVNEKK